VTGADLAADDFDGFFRELYGIEPFPWQRRLVRQVAATGQWPDLLDLPTGSGKTAMVDAAVFVLALRGDQPRRMVFVVDRRVVVQQAARRAERLASRLRAAVGTTGVLGAVAGRLRALCAPIGSDQVPLAWAELRGGVVRDDSWLRRPDTPTVLVSTVDQVGSRLLFRGYGVSHGMRPVHAGLLGNDVLYLLDEVHLARPFADTLSAISRRYRPDGSTGLPDRWRVVELSATPTGDQPGGARFSLEHEDRRSPVLARRLAASEPARLELVKSTGAGQRQALATAAARHATALLSRPGVRTVGVVVNRVDTAVRVYRQLAGELTEDRLVLLTGRMRALDRDTVLARYEPRLATGRERNDDDEPLVVVATQSIEAGADLDLDALVTECAPLDSLVQRFGRVDRAGDLARRGNPPTSVILASAQDIAAKADDPVYGTALCATWEWLQAKETLDFGIDAFPKALDWPAGVTRRPEHAPQLLPSHLDRWVQTSANPDADPDPAHWLHGLSPARAEVTVVWRADVRREAFPPHAPEPARASESLMQLVSLCPPASTEGMQLPVSAVRAWLAEGDVPPVSDAATFEPAVDDDTRSAGFRPALLWRGDDSRLATERWHVRPGDTVVVPACYGGVTASCWDPNARTDVTDLGYAAQRQQRGRTVLRLVPGCVPEGIEAGIPAIPDDAADVDHAQVVRDWLDLHPGDPRLDPVRNRPRITIAELSTADPPARAYVVSSRRAARVGVAAGMAEFEPSTSSFSGTPLALDTHLDDVRTWAGELAAAAGLPVELRGDLALAGYLHDLGKVDSRFQTWLRGGTLVDGEFGLRPLAKSGTDPGNRRARHRARLSAGYPVDARHELASVALVQHDERLRAEANDWDLVLHLVASHHGYARPFVPVADDPHPPDLMACLAGRTVTAAGAHGLERLDSGVPQRFWRCVRRYGWFGLAWLESILRLADHRASEEAQGDQPR